MQDVSELLFDSNNIFRDFSYSESYYFGGRLDNDASKYINMTNAFDRDINTGVSSMIGNVCPESFPRF